MCWLQHVASLPAGIHLFGDSPECKYSKDELARWVEGPRVSLAELLSNGWADASAMLSWRELLSNATSNAMSEDITMGVDGRESVAEEDVDSLRVIATSKIEKLWMTYIWSESLVQRSCSVLESKKWAFLRGSHDIEAVLLLWITSVALGPVKPDVESWNNDVSSQEMAEYLAHTDIEESFLSLWTETSKRVMALAGVQAVRNDGSIEVYGFDVMAALDVTVNKASGKQILSVLLKTIDVFLSITSERYALAKEGLPRVFLLLAWLCGKGRVRSIPHIEDVVEDYFQSLEENGSGMSDNVKSDFPLLKSVLIELKNNVLGDKSSFLHNNTDSEAPAIQQQLENIAQV